MTRKLLNSLEMFKAVDLYFDQNALLFADFEAIKTGHHFLKGEIAAIQKLSQTQSADANVQSGMKKIEKASLSTVIVKVNTAMNAVAITENDKELRLLTDISKTDLLKLREADFIIRINRIYNAAKSILDKLLKWGVTAEEVEMLDTTAASFAERSATMRNITAVTSNATNEINQKVKDVNSFLSDNLDKLLEPFKSMNVTLYGQYKIARKVIERAATQSAKVIEVEQA